MTKENYKGIGLILDWMNGFYLSFDFWVWVFGPFVYIEIWTKVNINVLNFTV